ncbi:MAG: cytochrome c biogenesis protein CcsA [Candidatus Hodarchaeales archaeon]
MNYINLGIVSFDIGAIFLLISLLLLFLDTILLFQPRKMKNWSKYSIYIYPFSVILFFLTFFYFVIAIISPDFSFTYVSSYVSKEMDIFLKLSAIWSGSAGSFFFWSFISMVFYVFFRIFFRGTGNEVIINRSTRILSFQVLGLVFLTWLGDPFALNSNIVTNGRGLNPILTNIWNITHPPIILIGYSLCLVPMAIALARISIMKKDSIPELMVQQRLDTFLDLCLSLAWLLLSTGIALGAYWAYVTLGWGGFWNWDPVQSSSLIPWLFITIYYHGRSIHKDNKYLENYIVSMTYVGVLFATFITRSSVLSSVHSFASDNKVIFILLLLGVSFLLPHYFGYSTKGIFNIDFALTKADFNSRLYKETSMKISYLCLLIGTYVLIGGLLVPIVYNSLSNTFPRLFEVLGVNSTIVITDSYFNTVLAIFGGLLLLLAYFCVFFANFNFRSRVLILIIGIISSSIFFIAGLGLFDSILGSNNLISILFKSFLTTSDKANFLIPLLLVGLIGILVNLSDIIFKKSRVNTFRRGSQSLLHLSFIVIILGAITSSNMNFAQTIEVEEGFIARVPDTELTIEMIEMIKEVPDTGRYSEVYNIKILITSEIFPNVNRTLKYGIDPIWGIDRKVTIVSELLHDVYVTIDQVLVNEDTGIFDKAVIQLKYIPLVSLVWIGILLLHLSILPLVYRRINLFVKASPNRKFAY